MGKRQQGDGSSPGGAAGAQPLGQVLIEQGAVTDEQLAEGLALQQTRGEQIGRLLCELGHVDAGAVREALVTQAGVPRATIDGKDIDPQALAAVPAEMAFRYKVLPLSSHNRSLTVAMADPFDRLAIESLRVLTGRHIERHYCPEPELLEAAQRVYGSSVARMIADLGAGPGAEVEQDDLALMQLQEMAREPSVVNLVNLIILEAVEARASDIHVEPFEKQLKIKYRIDGILHEVSPPPKQNLEQIRCGPPARPRPRPIAKSLVA